MSDDLFRLTPPAEVDAAQNREERTANDVPCREEKTANDAYDEEDDDSIEGIVDPSMKSAKSTPAPFVVGVTSEKPKKRSKKPGKKPKKPSAAGKKTTCKKRKLTQAEKALVRGALVRAKLSILNGLDR